MAALVGADRQRTGHVGERGVGAGGQRLLHHLDPEPEQSRGERGIGLGRPALVGIDDDPRLRGAGAHRLEARHVALAAELDLEQRTPGMFRRLGPHRGGIGQRQGIGGQPRQGRRQGGEEPDRHPLALRLPVPERAIDGIARGTGRQRLGQPRAGEGRLERPDLREHALDAFAVARVGNAFAAPARAVTLEGDRHHPRLGPRTAADREDLGEGKDLLDGVEPHSSASTSRPAPVRNGSTVGRPIRASISAR